MAFDISQQVKIVNPTANVDYYYGTYASIAEACASVPSEIRVKGKTVGILTDNGVVEYWWKTGIEDKDLVVKGGQGPKGEDGKDGIDGKDGANGVSVTHFWEGTTLTITSASGTSSADLKGEQGEQGERGLDGAKGADGYTPVKGTDYFTDVDKQEFITTLTPTIESLINQAIGEIENGTY